MRKLRLVARYEYRKATRRRSFWFATLGVPLLFVVIIGIVVVVSLRTGEEGAVGYIDESGVLAGAPPAAAGEAGASDGLVFQPYPDRESAEAALRAGEVRAVYLLPQDYLSSGRATLLYADREPSDRVQSAFAELIKSRLVAGFPPEVQARLLEGPAALDFRTADGRVETAGSGLARFIFPLVVGMFFLVTVMGSAGYLLQAVTDEKENRTMEIMTTSLSAEQLVVGKAVGLIGVSLTQVLVWLVVGVVALAAASPFVTALQSLTVPWDFLGLAVLFFLPSFVLEAALIIIIGAVVTDLGQGQQLSGILQFIFCLPLFCIPLVMNSPDSPVLVVLTLFPLTSFLGIALRWGATLLPWWQVALSFVLTAGAAGGMLLVAPRVFRRGMLRYGQRMSLRGVFQALRVGKA